MNSKKVGIIFIIIGISAILSFLIYPFLSEHTEKAVPALKSFSDSSISVNGSMEETVHGNSEILGNSSDKSIAETSLPNDEAQPETASAVTFPIDINAASVEELMQIKGIGRVVAENIVSYRENVGYFYSLEDLMNVDGMGDKRFDNIINYVYISEELLSETAAEVRETVSTAGTAYAAVTTVPQGNSSAYSAPSDQTSVKTTVTSVIETQDTDDGMIIEEITDFEDTGQEHSSVSKGKATDDSISDFETTSEEYYPNFPLELNTASAKDLAYINGVGEVLAERIVEYARTYGFYDVNDLLKVSGIGQSKFGDIVPYVYVDASGLPPKTETTVSSFYDDLFDSSGDTSYIFPSETTASDAPEIYRVNVNTASKADFMQLPGIDETLAENIISLRSQIGGFAAIEELSLADGMTNSRLSAIWNYIYV